MTTQATDRERDAMSDKTIPAFHVTHEAWYWQAIRDTHSNQPEIMVGMYDPDDGGGCDYEWGIRWHSLDAARTRLSPQVQIFHDAWPAFTDPTMGTLFTRLAQIGDAVPTPEEVKAALLELGFADLTERTRTTPTAPEATA